MVYPQEFSAEARARIEAERLKAGRDLAQYRNRPETRPPRSRHTWGTYERRWTDDEEDFFGYILRVFLVFAHEACELGKQGTWAVDHIRSEVDKFLRRFGVEAYNEKGYDRSGHKFRQMVDDWYGTLLPEVEQEFQKSERWRQFEEELLTVAEHQARRTPQAAQPATMNGANGGDRKGRRTAVEAFIAEVTEAGRKITRKDIWTVAGYTNATEFERFQRGDPRTTSSAATAFNRVLGMKPEKFIELLGKKPAAK